MIEVDMGQEKDLRASGPEDLPDGPFIVRAEDAEAGIEQNRPVAVQEIRRDLGGPDDVKTRDNFTGRIENQLGWPFSTQRIPPKIPFIIALSAQRHAPCVTPPGP